MKTSSMLWLLVACAAALIVSGSTRPAWAQDDPGPLGVEFGVVPPVAGSAAFPCTVAVRSLLTGERILLEKFNVEPGKDATLKKSSKGFDVDAEVKIAPGGSSVYYSISVATTAHRPLGIYAALLKLHS